MKTMRRVLENAEIDAWARHFARAPYQLNGTHEADAELIEIPGNRTHVLAVTADTVAEEITEGLYQDPFTMGWVTVMASLSDLAAVGADPLGLVVSVSVESSRSQSFRDSVACGMSAACRELGIFIIGGDTNTSRTISLTGCAFGLVPREEIITRIGCGAGEEVFLSGLAGIGSALGLSRFSKNCDGFRESSYHPVARIKEGHLIRRYATCCMDTSDGVLATLDQLMRLNGVGFRVESGSEQFLDPIALRLARIAGLPAWLMLAGPHGEFELLFTVPPARVEAFLRDATELEWSPLRIGMVSEEEGVWLTQDGCLEAMDTGYIRNLFLEVNGDVDEYIKRLVKLDSSS